MSNYYVSCARMKELEKATDESGLSYYQMMENAGTIAANRITEITMATRQRPHPSSRQLTARIYCGKGNNGGDGFVVARILKQRGWIVSLVLVDGEPQTPDAITNYRLTKDLQIPVQELGAGQGETMAQDVVVDAIYGTGFHGRLREKGAAAAAEIADAKAAGAKVFALDIPSGMGGDLEDESELDERCVRADVTITFHAKKKVHLQPFAKTYCGQIITADIGIVDDERDAVTEQDAADGRTAAELAAKDVYTFHDFVDIVAQLRAPDGCVWDRAQTHETLTKYMIEEAQEAVDAMLNGDDENLCEELGDVLLQVVLNAQIGAEDGVFTIDDVIQGISEKMIRRHPWVFGDMDVSSIDENVSLWEQIKQKEKEAKKK
ncbi:MAG: NAD(P)H-hydrate epimerase [Firmicutes bacterium]|nr:NAD(P)H-hydrate epimerase [Bacillota bacterium]